MKPSGGLLEGVSVVINTRNEERNILNCIKSTGNFPDEIVVVDMVSEDKTIEYAKSRGAKIYRIKNYGYVEPARNYAIDKAKHEWILLLDADERLTPILKRTLQTVVKDDNYDAVKMPFKNIIFGKWIKHTGWWPDYHCRFFKKRSVNWSTVIHKEPRIVGRELILASKEENAIIHYNYRNINQWVEKMNKYTSVEKVLNSDNLKSVEEVFNYFEKEFSFRYIVHKGYLDGMYGFVLSKFMEFYRFLEIAKYWEKEEYKEIFNRRDFYKCVEEHYSRRYPVAEIKKLKDQIRHLNRQLRLITSSKTYKLWQSYCKLRGYFFIKMASK